MKHLQTEKRNQELKGRFFATSRYNILKSKATEKCYNHLE